MSVPEWYIEENRLYTRNTCPLSKHIEHICHGEFTVENVLNILNEMEEDRKNLIYELLDYN